jgi:alpha-1,3-mannosyltransferase
VSGLHQIDLAAYAEQSKIYMTGSADYSKLIGDTGPIQYPAASLYLYSFFNWLTDYNINKHNMSDVHVVLDIFRMWLLVRIYKRAYGSERGAPKNRKMYVFVLLLLQAKYKFVGITHQFNDCFMMICCLMAIHFWQYGYLWISATLLGIAVNIKMSALLMIPGYALTVAFEAGLIRAVLSVAWIIGLQIIIGIEFLMANPQAYFSMAYNFDRVFLKQEQVNFQFMTQEFMHSDGFNKFLLAMHLGFLLLFLVFKWTDNLLKDVRLFDLLGDLTKRREICQYKSLLIIFTSNLIGMMCSRGTHQQFYSWYSYSFPFLVDAAWENHTLTKFALIICLEIAWTVAKPRSPL